MNCSQYEQISPLNIGNVRCRLQISKREQNSYTHNELDQHNEMRANGLDLFDNDCRYRPEQSRRYCKKYAMHIARREVKSLCINVNYKYDADKRQQHQEPLFLWNRFSKYSGPYNDKQKWLNMIYGRRDRNGSRFEGLKQHNPVAHQKHTAHKN